MGRRDSPFVYCAGGGWEVDKKAFIIRIQLPDLHDVKHFGKKPTNEWMCFSPFSLGSRAYKRYDLGQYCLKITAGW